MSDEAVKAKTGKTWKEWFAILDKAGASKMNHQEIVKYLNTKQGFGPWWQQMVSEGTEDLRSPRFNSLECADLSALWSDANCHGPYCLNAP